MPGRRVKPRAWNPSDAATYALRHGYVETTHVVEGDLTVVSSPGRHPGFLILSREGRSLALKRAAGKAERRSIAREARVYRFLAAVGVRSRLRRHLLRCGAFDQDEGVLALESAPGARSLQAHLRGRRRFPVAVATALGDAVAALHELGPAASLAAVKELGPTRPPQVLSISGLRSELLPYFSSGSLEVVKAIQKSEALGRTLEDLSATWSATTLVHGDLKWDNCLLLSRSPGTRRRLALIDWEFAGAGDPCWDVGSVLASFLGTWLLSIPLIPDLAPRRLVDLAERPLEGLQPAIRAFWSRYRERRADRESADAALVRSIRYGASRLVQTALEISQDSPGLTPHAACFVQVAENVARRPVEAAVHLLGLSPRESASAVVLP